MNQETWFPKGYCVAEGMSVQTHLFSGDAWQIYATDSSENILVARPELARRWIDSDLLDKAVFSPIRLGSESLLAFSSRKEFVLAPVTDGGLQVNKEDALAFAYALRDSRNVCANASLHDSIYVEQYSRLLPTWTDTLAMTDDIVFGTWLSGGVVISTKSFRRLCSLAGWMSSADLREVIEIVGSPASRDTALFKQKNEDRKRDEKASEIVDGANLKKDHQQEAIKEREKTFSLPGRPQLEHFFNEHILDIILNVDRYQALGIEFPSAVVLHGPPGCGKTYAVERLVEFIDWPSYSIDSNSIGSPYIHATSKKISEVFDTAIDTAPSVIIIDEMESFLSDRRSSGTSSTHHVEEVAEFLRRIPEAIANKVLVIAMTNMIEVIDPAILRRGRFDHIIEVGMPTRMEIEALLNALLKNVPHSPCLNLDTAIGSLTGKALSDSSFVVREGARLAAKSGKAAIDQECVDEAVKRLPQEKERKGRPIGFHLDS